MKRTIEIDSESLFFKIFEGTDKEEECCAEETCLALLLFDGMVFSNERDTVFQGEPAGSTVVLYVNCNDMFAWASADAELLPHEEIPSLTKMHLADPKWGAMKWCMLRRN